MVIGQPISHIKLTKDEGSRFEKTFWELIIGSEDVLNVYSFWRTYIVMFLNRKDYVTLDAVDEVVDFRYKYRVTMIT